jgi:hypothetical protein
MDRFYLYIICASILLLVTAFALGTAGLKSEGPSQNKFVVTSSASMKRALVLAEERLNSVGYLTVGQMQIPSAPATFFGQVSEVESSGGET